MSNRKPYQKNNKDKDLTRRNQIIAMLVGITVIFTFVLEFPQKISSAIDVFKATNTPVFTNTPTPSATLTPEPPHVSPISFLGHRADCLGYNVTLLPNNLVPLLENNAPSVDIKKYYSLQETGYWYPDLSGSMYYAVTIQNNSTESNWVRLNNSVRASINKLENTNQNNINTHNRSLGCGGMSYRKFPPIELIGSQDIVLKYKETDSFSLHPGEYEDFLFSIQCKETGIYQITYEVSVITQGQERKEKIEGGNYVCPKVMTEWRIGDGDKSFRKYINTWNNKEYDLTVPFQRYDKYVVTIAGEPLDLRVIPSIEGTIIEKLQAGLVLYFADGPVQADGYTWWHVFTWNRPEETWGWVAENPDWYIYYGLYVTPSP